MIINTPIEIGQTVCVKNPEWMKKMHGEQSTGKINSIKVYIKKNSDYTVCFSAKINGYNETYNIKDDRIISIN